MNNETLQQRLAKLETRNLKIALNQARCLKPEVVAAYKAELAGRRK